MKKTAESPASVCGLEEIYGHEREGIREIVKLVLLDFNKKGLFYSIFFEFDVKS